MLKKKMVQNVIEHIESKLVPHRINFTQPVEIMLRKYFNCIDVEEKIGNFLFHVHSEPPEKFRKERERDNRNIDEFGCLWQYNKDNIGYVVGYPLKKPSLKGYHFPNPYKKGRFEKISHSIEKKKNLFIFYSFEWTLFERAYFLRGMEDLMTDFILHPLFVHELLDAITEYDLSIIDQVMDFNIDGFIFSDDYGHQKDLLISPRLWKEFIKPRLRKIFERVKEKNKKVFLHSDGKIIKIIPDLIDIGIDGLHPIQPEALDIVRLKKEYGRDITFYGGISTQKTLPFGTIKTVKDEIERAIKILNNSGGYILAPAIKIQSDVPLCNILAFIESASSLR